MVAILVVNNLRDIEGDAKAGKRTTAVRFGAQWTQREYVFLLVLAFFTPVLMALSGLLPAWVLLGWLGLPMALELVRRVGTDTGRALNRTLAGTGTLELVFSVFFASGLIFGRYL